MERPSRGLRWPPLHAIIDQITRSGDPLILVVAPFIKLEALKSLFEEAPVSNGCRVVCRWQPLDLVAGVSDLEVYGYLKDRGWDFFVNQQIHMKLYVFESNLAFATSGNLTMTGLGYVDAARANVEVGTIVELTAQDWVNLYRVIAESRLITPELYARFEEYVRTHPPPQPSDPAPDLLGPPKKYTLAALPATETPDTLADFYFSMSSVSQSPDLERRGYHDLATFDIRGNFSRQEFEIALEAAWRRNPFVQDFVEYLRRNGSLRFGAVNTWIHEKCEDVPLPYRWEVKNSTRIFYNWMAHYFAEVSWGRPHYSQVISWNEK
jgi:hypothetical protein